MLARSILQCSPDKALAPGKRYEKRKRNSLQQRHSRIPPQGIHFKVETSVIHPQGIIKICRVNF